MSDAQHHEYTCPVCKGQMTLDIEPGRQFLVRHQLPACAESAHWPGLANGAVIVVEHVEFSAPAACEHVWIEHPSGDFCDKCSAERSRVERA